LTLINLAREEIIPLIHLARELQTYSSAQVSLFKEAVRVSSYTDTEALEG